MDDEERAFALRVTENGHGTVVLVAGDLDLETAPKLRACLRDFTGQSVTLDFSDVTFLDSTGIGVLVSAKGEADRAGGSIVLHGVQPAQMKVLEICGLIEYLNFDGDGAAVTS
jgi:anti-anti-sigma factor